MPRHRHGALNGREKPSPPIPHPIATHLAPLSDRHSIPPASTIAWMQHNDWDKIADTFEDTIFSVFHNDRKGLIAKRIRNLGSGKKTANDLGSGVGHCPGTEFSR